MPASDLLGHTRACRGTQPRYRRVIGDLVAFLADDRWLPEKLARQVAALAAAPDAGLCYTIARFVDADDRPLPLRQPPRAIEGNLFSALMRGNLIIIASVVARRRCLDEVGGFDETLPVYGCEDWDVWLRIARRHPVAVVDDELTLYRVHAGNTPVGSLLASGLAVLDRRYAEPGTAEAAGCRGPRRGLAYAGISLVPSRPNAAAPRCR